jgi:hypothetical protein
MKTVDLKRSISLIPEKGLLTGLSVFFPHSVELGPGESQVVKIQLTKINELAPGEYRSHLYFRAVPDKAPLGEDVPAKDSGISIRLIPVFGISIPVIIRVGAAATQVRLSDLSVQMVEDTIPILEMTFHRTGNMSVYGDITVYYTSPAGKTTLAGTAKGIVYRRRCPSPKNHRGGSGIALILKSIL